MVRFWTEEKVRNPIVVVYLESIKDIVECYTKLRESGIHISKYAIVDKRERVSDFIRGSSHQMLVIGPIQNNVNLGMEFARQMKSENPELYIVWLGTPPRVSEPIDLSIRKGSDDRYFVDLTEEVSRFLQGLAPFQ
jgi:hypothetical protein